MAAMRIEQLDPCTMRLRDIAHDRQSKATSFGTRIAGLCRFAIAAPEESIEHALTLGRRNARASVLDLYGHRTSAHEPHIYSSTLRLYFRALSTRLPKSVCNA